MTGSVDAPVTLVDGVELLTPHREGDSKAFANELGATKDPIDALLREALQATPEECHYILGMTAYEYFASYYLPHHFTAAMSENYHPDVFRLLRDVETHRTAMPTLIAGPRKIGKSTNILLTVLHALHFPFFRLAANGRLQDLSKRYIAFLNSTLPMAYQPLASTVFELETNEKLHMDFGNLLTGKGVIGRPLIPVKRRVENKGEVVLATGQILQAFGRRSKIRGTKRFQFRLDLICGDDLENDETVASSDRRTSDMQWITKAVINALSETGNALFNGTMLHSNSMLNQLAEFGKAHNWNVRVYPVYEDTPQGRKYLWESRFGAAWVKETLEKMPQSAFDQEFLQRPSSGMTELTYESFTFYKYEDIIPMLESGRLVVTLGVDPACRTSERSDYSALVPVARDPSTGIMYVLPALIQRLNFAGKLNAIIAESQRVNAHRVGIETVQFQIALKEALDQRAQQEGLLIPTVDVKQTVDKYLRISSIFHMIQNGMLRFTRHRSHATIMDQLINLYDTKYDDGADALEIAIRVQMMLAKTVKRRSGVLARIV